MYLPHKIFSGLKVLDLSTVLAGPSVATFFAELGADVLKVESPAGDVTRSWKLPGEQAGGISAYFASANFGKRYITLDLKTQRASLEAHLAWADVLISNFKVDDYVKFELEHEQLAGRYPGLIDARIRGFETDLERVAYDTVLQAETGYMHMNGTEESGPVKMPVAMMDILAAHQLKEGILCALIERMKTNRGCLIQCSIEGAGIASLANQAANYLMTGHVPARQGSLHPNIAPYGETMTCGDQKMIVLAVGSDAQFAALLEILKLEDLKTDARFISNTSRVQHRNALKTVLQKAFEQKPSAEWIQQLNEKKIPAGLIRSMDEVMESDCAKAMLLEEEINGVPTKRVSSIAFKQY